MATRTAPEVPPHDGAPSPDDEYAVSRIETPQPLAHASETAASSLAARARAEIEARTFLALSRPRSVANFRTKLLQACERTRFAEGARYSKPLGGGKYATGLSIRAAEEAARHYGNLDIAVFVISDDDERRVFRAAVTDLEANLTFSTEVIVLKTVERRNPRPGDERIRSRTTSQGNVVHVIRADEDALLTKGNSAISKAVRNLILDHVPSDIQEEVEERILATLANEEKRDPTAARKRMVDSFFALGVMPAQLEEYLGHPLATTTPAESVVLKAIFTAMKDEGVQWADVMSDRAVKAGAEAASTGKSAAAGLRNAVKSKAEKPAAQPPKEPEGKICIEANCGGKDGQHTPQCRFYSDPDPV